MACNSAVIRLTKEQLLPSCSSRDSASDEKARGVTLVMPVLRSATVVKMP